MCYDRSRIKACNRAVNDRLGLGFLLPVVGSRITTRAFMMVVMIRQLVDKRGGILRQLVVCSRKWVMVIRTEALSPRLVGVVVV